MLLYVSVRELHTDMKNKGSTYFSMAYDERGIFFISGYALQLLIPPHLLKITYCYQIMCGWKICIQSGTYQDYLNHWRKTFIPFFNCEKTFMSGSDEKLNVEHIYSYKVRCYYQMENLCSLYPIQNVCFLKQYHQKSIVKYVWTENDIRIYFLFRLLKLNFKLTQILT